MLFLPLHMKARFPSLRHQPIDIWIANNIQDAYINNEFLPGTLFMDTDVSENQVLCTLR